MGIGAKREPLNMGTHKGTSTSIPLQEQPTTTGHEVRDAHYAGQLPHIDIIVDSISIRICSDQFHIESQRFHDENVSF